MRVTAELSLYPLQEAYLAPVRSFIRGLSDAPDLSVTVNQMSTQVSGELRDVIRAVESALEVSFGEGGKRVLVAKFLNADLPIHESPDLGPEP